jgi:hypothetical protein
LLLLPAGVAAAAAAAAAAEAPLRRCLLGCCMVAEIAMLRTVKGLVVGLRTMTLPLTIWVTDATVRVACSEKSTTSGVRFCKPASCHKRRLIL